MYGGIDLQLHDNLLFSTQFTVHTGLYYDVTAYFQRVNWGGLYNAVPLAVMGGL